MHRKRWRPAVSSGPALADLANTTGFLPFARGGNYRSHVASWGAVSDGVTDNKAALQAAINEGAVAGYPITGGGLTYGIAGALTLPANTELQDINFKQLTPGASSAVRTLTSSAVNNIRLVRVGVNRNGNGTNGSTTFDAAGIWIDGGTGHYLEDVEVYGDDMGSGLTIWNASKFDVVRLHCHDIKYVLGSDPGDDRVQGFWFNACSNFRLIAPRVHDLGGNHGSGFTTKWSRNPFGGCTGWTLIEPDVWNVGQGIDLTGSAGNTRWRILGGHVRDCESAGYKFANSARDGKIIGAIAERCGLTGFYFSGPAEAGLPIKTGDIEAIDCTAFDIGSNGFYTTSERPAGFLIEVGDFDPTLSPLGIRFIDCDAIDRQTVPTMKYGFAMHNGLPAALTDGRYNELVGNCRSVGHTAAASFGFHESRCGVSRAAAQSIADNTWTDVLWTSDDDKGEMHNTAASEETIFPRRLGTYQCRWGIAFAANATGQRGIRILKDNAIVAGTTQLVDAAAAGETALQALLTDARSTLGGGYKIQVFQNSGGALNLQTTSGGTVVQV